MAEFSLESMKASLSSIQIPILILDERYRIALPERLKTPDIVRLEAELAELLKQQGKITESIKDVKKLKTRLLQDVVQNMEDGADEDEYKAQLEKSNKLLAETKSKLQELEDRDLELPKEIKEANQALLLEVISLFYGRMQQNKKDVELLNRWINQIRVELKKKLVIKQEKESQNANMYAYMHDVLGAELITMFDEAEKTEDE
ncbi:MAG: hypothetical protein K6C69_01820 [Lachnospiraceae bacterium]|nr:hypothetical protein [Lachnospiraceae bacterium]